MPRRRLTPAVSIRLPLKTLSARARRTAPFFEKTLKLPIVMTLDECSQ